MKSENGPKSRDLGSLLLFSIMNIVLKKALLFIPFLFLFQLILAGLTVVFGPIINLGQFNLEDFGRRLFTFYFMGLWIGVGFYWVLYFYFVFLPKLNKTNWQVVVHLFMALAFTIRWGQNAGGLMFLGIP